MSSFFSFSFAFFESLLARALALLTSVDNRSSIWGQTALNQRRRKKKKKQKWHQSACSHSNKRDKPGYSYVRTYTFLLGGLFSLKSLVDKDWYIISPSEQWRELAPSASIQRICDSTLIVWSKESRYKRCHNVFCLRSVLPSWYTE